MFSYKNLSLSYCLIFTQRSRAIIWHDAATDKHFGITSSLKFHDDVIKWKHLSRFWPFVTKAGDEELWCFLLPDSCFYRKPAIIPLLRWPVDVTPAKVQWATSPWRTSKRPSCPVSAIKADIEEVFKTLLGDRLERIEARLDELAQLKQVVTDLRKSAEDTSERMEDLLKVTIPALAKHFEDVTSALVMRQLDQDVHRRKWSLTIQGLPGDAKEDEGDTRRACVDFAKAHLGVPDASERDFAACHRLNQRSDAGIIARFTDLQQRDRWLLGARGLKNSDLRVSISPDLPPDRWRRSFSRNGEHYPLQWNQRPISVTCDSGPMSNCLWAKTMTPFDPALSHVPSSKVSWELPRCLPPWNREPPWWHKPYCKYLYS